MDRGKRHRGRDADVGVQSSIRKRKGTTSRPVVPCCLSLDIIALSRVIYPCIASTLLKDASGPYLGLRAGSHAHLAKGTFILIM
jgi:hypothetical protein